MARPLLPTFNCWSTKPSRAAAGDPRWRVRAAVASAVRRLLHADWDRTVSELLRWGTDDNPLVVRVAASVGDRAQARVASAFAEVVRTDASEDVG